MRKPPPRLIDRDVPIGKGELCSEIPNERNLHALQARLTFEPYSKHKWVPRTFKLEPYNGERRDCTYCDFDAGFTVENIPAIAEWMAAGIRAGLISARTDNGDPAFIWAVGNDGWIYEGRPTSPGSGKYHGYPLIPWHPNGPSILDRYERAAPDAERENLIAARKRYRGR